MKKYTCTHLVKSEDLNHHGTLFAGRMAEWFVEASFVAAAGLHGEPADIVCIKVHGMKFPTPVSKGSLLFIYSKVVSVGTTSLTVYTYSTAGNEDTVLTDGFVTFVCVDDEGKKKPHGIIMKDPEDDYEAKLRSIAKELK
jgi:acyl-CoA hydrolase